MAQSYKQLAQTQAATSATAVYTAPADTQAIVKHMRIVNTDTVPRWIKLWNNGTSDSNLILPQTNIPAGGWAEFDGTITMAATNTISAQGEVASKITITIHGAEVT